MGSSVSPASKRPFLPSLASKILCACTVHSNWTMTYTSSQYISDFPIPFLRHFKACHVFCIVNPFAMTAQTPHPTPLHPTHPTVSHSFQKRAKRWFGFQPVGSNMAVYPWISLNSTEQKWTSCNRLPPLVNQFHTYILIHVKEKKNSPELPWILTPSEGTAVHPHCFYAEELSSVLPGPRTQPLCPKYVVNPSILHHHFSTRVCASQIAGINRSKM